jgi:HEAT repeat protein
MVNRLIQFVEYRTAARILSHLNRRQQKLEEAKDTYAGVIAKSLERKLEPSTKKLFVEDLKSGDPSRQKNVAQLLSGLRQVATPLLIEIIKKEDDYRVRQIAALLLKKQGPAAAEPLKRMLVLEIDPVERVRILEIIDNLSSDLKVELAHALGDTDARVQEAAFRLAERLNDEQTIQLLMDLVKSQQGDLSVASIKCLVKLNPSKADEALKELLSATQDDELSITCCRALGQIGNPDSIEILSKMLAPKGFFLLKKKRSNAVRAAAAFALGRIAHPQAREVLAPFINDGDPRIRETAKSVQAPAAQAS